jgi:phage terminase small subunit
MGTELAYPSVREAIFAREYAASGKKQQAAVIAGYTPRSAAVEAKRLLKKLNVQALIQDHMEKAAAPTILDKQRVLLEYMRVGFVNPQDFLDELGRPIPVKDLPRSIAAAISQIEVEEIQRRDDETGELESVSIKTKLKLHPKLPALEVLAKHVGLIGDNPGVTVNVNGDGDVHVHSDRELALAIIAQLQKGLAEQPAPKTVQGSAKHG